MNHAAQSKSLYMIKNTRKKLKCLSHPRAAKVQTSLRIYTVSPEPLLLAYTYEPRLEIFNNVACATSKVSDQPAHMRSLIRAFASRLNVL